MFSPSRIRIVVPRPWGHALAAVLLLLGAMPLLAQTPLTLQLKWSHGFQFAGYYAAQEKGFYREAGFEVKLLEARPGLNVVAEVSSGRADFGVGTSGLLMARQAGEPVVVLAAIFQHSPLVLIARQDAYLQSIHDLVGRRVMIEPGSDELLAYLRRERIPLDSLTRVEHSFEPEDLISGKVDAISAYSSNEPYALDKAGMNYHVFTPRSAGIDFYGDNLFTSENRVKYSPELVRAFREASLRGWRYAMDHPEEVAALIHSRYSDAQPLDFYLFEARRMVPLVRPDLVEIGYMNPGRWQHIVDTYGDMGMLPRDFDFRGFLYAEGGAGDSEGLRLYLAAALGGLALVIAVATYIHRINRQLHRSVAEARLAAGELQASEEKYRVLTETMKDVVWTADADTLRFTYVSPSIERLRGYTVAEVLGSPIESAVKPSERNTLRSLVRQRSRAFRADPDGPPHFYTEVYEQPCKDGSSVWTEVVTTYGLHPRSGILEVHGVTRDITERRASQERITHMAEHDLLTDLPNRALVTDRLSLALATARRNRHRVALLYIDLDRFKPINDTYGHAVGDLLLQEAAARMRACVRESDTVGRFGGDEFVVLLPVVEGAVDALRVAEKIRAALGEPFLLAGLCLEVSSSIGVALYPEDGRDQEALLLSADRIMYEAKREGRDRVSMSAAG
ncbi:MAG: ABC transporter substrate-binding protein [Zoogloea sp.]|nr:ABC transporter substrate-binding protein [Zoogloea sp.]